MQGRSVAQHLLLWNKCVVDKVRCSQTAHGNAGAVKVCCGYLNFVPKFGVGSKMLYKEKN